MDKGFLIDMQRGKTMPHNFVKFYTVGRKRPDKATLFPTEEAAREAVKKYGLKGAKVVPRATAV